MNIQQKINNYSASHPELAGTKLIEAMVAEGQLTMTEAEIAKTSIFMNETNFPVTSTRGGASSTSTQNTTKVSIFGSGSENTNGMGLEVSISDSITDYTPAVEQEMLIMPRQSGRAVAADIPLEAQEDILTFMNRMLDGANRTMAARESEAGIISQGVNGWLEIINSENAKSHVAGDIASTKSDIKLLQKAHDGTLGDYTFAEEFKICRGVEYNQKNINDCKAKAEHYEFVKTITTMVSEAKEALAQTTRGDLTSQMSPEAASAAIINALHMCGANTVEDINNFLNAFEEREVERNNKDFTVWGNNLHVIIKKGKPVIYRETARGNLEPATNNQLRIISLELCKNLDRECARALGATPPQNATAQQLAQITQNQLDNAKKAYQKSFEKAFGKKDIQILSENFAQSQAKYVAYVEMGIDMLSMAAMLLPGAGEMAAGWLLKCAQTTGKGVGLAQKAVGMTQKVAQGAQALAPYLMANVTLHPAKLVEKLTSPKGMTKEDWAEWSEEVLKNSLYMLGGMGASKIAQEIATMYKTRALVNALKSEGKTIEELQALMNARPQNFPADILKSMQNIGKVADALQISSESALTLSSTLLINKAFGYDGLSEIDWVMSIGTALMGAKLQRSMADMPEQAQINYLKDVFSNVEMTDEMARDLLLIMNDINAGRLDPHTGLYQLSEATVYGTQSKTTPNETTTEPRTNTTESHSTTRSHRSRSTHIRTPRTKTTHNTAGTQKFRMPESKDFLQGQVRQDTKTELLMLFKDDTEMIQFLANANDAKFDQMLVLFKNMKDSNIDPVTGKAFDPNNFKSTMESRFTETFNFERKPFALNFEDTPEPTPKEIEFAKEIEQAEINARKKAAAETMAKAEAEAKTRAEAKAEAEARAIAEAEAEAIAKAETNADLSAKNRATAENIETARYRDAFIKQFGYTENDLNNLSLEQFEELRNLSFEIARINQFYEGYEPKNIHFLGDVIGFNTAKTPEASRAVEALISNPKFKDIVMEYKGADKAILVKEGYSPEIPAGRQEPNYLSKPYEGTSELLKQTDEPYRVERNLERQQEAKHLIDLGFNKNIVEDLDPTQFDILVDMVKNIETFQRENNVNFQKSKSISEACNKIPNEINIDPILEKFNVDAKTQAQIKAQRTEQTAVEQTSLVSQLSNGHHIETEKLGNFNIRQLREINEFLSKIEEKAYPYMFSDTKVQYTQRVEEILANCTDDAVRDIVRQTYMRR